MLDYKNNTIEHLEEIDNYIDSLQEDKEILVKSIENLKEELSILNAGAKRRPTQIGLFEGYDEFLELAAYNVDDILSAGEKPYSLFTQDQILCELNSNGVTTIINLMQEHEFMIYNDEALYKEFNVINIPIVDNSVPSLEVLYEIMYIINNNKKTYIHCNLGLGRTGVVVAFYLYKKYAYRGLNIVKKLKDLKSKSKLEHKDSLITKEQREFVLKLL